MRLHSFAIGALFVALAVPAMAHAEETVHPKRRGDLTTIEVGATVFAIAYVPALVAGLEGAGSGSASWVDVFPIIGPYVSGAGFLSASGGLFDGTSHGIGALLVVDGVVQTLGTIVFTAGFLVPRSTKDTATRFRVTSFGVAQTSLVVCGTF